MRYVNLINHNIMLYFAPGGNLYIDFKMKDCTSVLSIDFLLNFCVIFIVKIDKEKQPGKSELFLIDSVFNTLNHTIPFIRPSDQYRAHSG